jgi:pyruvate/2-oxoglutarate dehydrogenase complex dihydrolipoamide acyltransferase (E2) component
MKIEVRFPQWGMGLTEGTVLEWLKSVGDAVAEDEPLVEVETAKATDVVCAPAAGVLTEIVAEPATVVTVSELLGVIEAPGS